MEMLCYLIVVLIVAVVILAWLKIRHAYGDSGNTDKPASSGVGGEFADGAKHKQVGIRPCCTRLNADVVVDILRFSSPDTIDACCLSSEQLNSIVASLKSSRPLRSIDFARIAERTEPSTGHWLRLPIRLEMRCHTQGRDRPPANSLRIFDLNEIRFALSNSHVRRLRIDDLQGESIEKLAAFTGEERCHIEELEINLIFSSVFMDAEVWETVWRVIATLSPSRIHCAFNEKTRRYKCLSTPGFVNAQHVVVEGNMRATERVLRYVLSERRGSLCWLSNEKTLPDNFYFVEDLIEKFQAQTEIFSFEHPLFLQFPYRPICWYSLAYRIKKNVGLAPIDDLLDVRNMAQFYPEPQATFDKHVVRVSDEYKAFVLENARGQRISVVASDDDASMMDGDYWLQRIAFVPDLSILGV